MQRRLTLKKETLTELATVDLRDVVGAALMSGPTCPVNDCVHSYANCPPTLRSCLATCYCTPPPA